MYLHTTIFQVWKTISGDEFPEDSQDPQCIMTVINNCLYSSNTVKISLIERLLSMRQIACLSCWSGVCQHEFIFPRPPQAVGNAITAVRLIFGALLKN